MGCGDSREAVSQMLPEASSVLLSLPLTIIPNPDPVSFLLWRFSEEKDELEVRAFGKSPSDADAGLRSGMTHGRSTLLHHRRQLLLCLADLP